MTGTGTGAGATGPGTGGSGATAGSGTSGSAGTGGSAGAVGTGGAGAVTSTGGAGGSTGGSGGDGPLPTTPDELEEACTAMNGAVNAGVTRLRRLTRLQLTNTVRDLIGATGDPGSALAPDEHIGPFQSNGIAPITDLLVEQHQEIAKAVAREAEPRMNQIAPCDLAADSGSTCANQFVTEFGLKAYRRPLSAAETSGYLALYELGRAAGAANGFRLVVETMLQAPQFLYHSDAGTAGTPQSTAVTLTAYELASRLSYFLWNTMPDATLFARAADNTLNDDAVLGAEVTRLLADPRAATTIALFHQQWLGLEELAAAEKDPALFPSFTPDLADAMNRELGSFSDHVIRQGDGLLRTLFTSNLAFPEGALFDIYGIAEPAGYTVGTPVELDPTRRAGLLTQAAFLTRHAHRDQTSPVHRGLLVRENILCKPIDAPPNNVAAVAPPPDPATSTRQRFEQHSTDPSCAGCHVLMDPIGLGFESYDSIGAYRTMDGLGPVDASGNFEDVGADLAGPFVGAVELANKLAGSVEVRNCVGNQWFRFSLGRIETQSDACSIVSIRQSLAASGGNIRAMLSQIALSQAFRHVRSNG